LPTIVHCENHPQNSKLHPLHPSTNLLLSIARSINRIPRTPATNPRQRRRQPDSLPPPSTPSPNPQTPDTAPRTPQYTPPDARPAAASPPAHRSLRYCMPACRVSSGPLFRRIATYSASPAPSATTPSRHTREAAARSPRPPQSATPSARPSPHSQLQQYRAIIVHLPPRHHRAQRPMQRRHIEAGHIFDQMKRMRPDIANASARPVHRRIGRATLPASAPCSPAAGSTTPANTPQPPCESHPAPRSRRSPAHPAPAGTPHTYASTHTATPPSPPPFPAPAPGHTSPSPACRSSPQSPPPALPRPPAGAVLFGVAITTKSIPSSPLRSASNISA
jgi:hypothetical protein